MQRNEESDEFASSVRASAAQINEGPRPPVRARCQQAPRTQNQHALGSAARSGDVEPTPFALQSRQNGIDMIENSIKNRSAKVPIEFDRRRTGTPCCAFACALAPAAAANEADSINSFG